MIVKRYLQEYATLPYGCTLIKIINYRINSLISRNIFSEVTDIVVIRIRCQIKSEFLYNFTGFNIQINRQGYRRIISKDNVFYKTCKICEDDTMVES
jgi:hypothetical protein